MERSTNMTKLNKIKPLLGSNKKDDKNEEREIGRRDFIKYVPGIALGFLLAEQEAQAGTWKTISTSSTALTPPAGTAILKANSGGQLANAVAGTDYAVAGTATTWSAPQTIASGRFETCVDLTTGTSIDVSTGSVFLKTITGAATLSVANVPATGKVASFILDITNGGSATVTWWSGIKWSGGTAPTLTTSGRDMLGFYTHDGGTTWNGLLLLSGNLSGNTITIAGGTCVNVRTAALAAGWDGSSAATVAISANVGSNSTSTPALTISGSFSGGLTLNINSGVYIVGCGGAGGNTYTAGNAGGTALSVSSFTGAYLKIQNNGVIGGGGGGGGDYGGGGAGLSAGAAGGGGSSSGTLTNGGTGNGGAAGGAAGSAGTTGSNPGSGFYSNGGGGGGLGAAGGAGHYANGGTTSGDSSVGDPDPTFSSSSYAGGAAGSATSGNSSITWLTTGTLYGALN